MQTEVDILKTLINEKNVSKATLAALLFPNNGCKRQAIERILTGAGKLTFEQVGTLATFAGMSVNDIATGEGWKAKLDEVGYITFNKPPFSACYCAHTGITIVTDGQQFHAETITPHTDTLSGYLAKLEKLILQK
jgi:hypothetical protein